MICRLASGDHEVLVRDVSWAEMLCRLASGDHDALLRAVKWAGECTLT